MLRHGEEHAAAGDRRRTKLREHCAVVLDVLDDVEATDHVELAPEWNVPRVHLHEARARRSGGREREALGRRLASSELQRRERRGHPGQHEARAATDFEQTACPGKIAPDGPRDQAVARPEPEIPRFEPRQLCKLGRIIAACASRLLRRERRVASD